MRTLCRSLFRGLLLACLVGCGGPSSTPARTTSDGRAVQAQASASEGSVALDSACVDGGDERCDALDSDCDGRVDEGCEGALQAPIVVAAAWNTPALVRLEVTGPQTPDASGAPACEAPRRAYQSFTTAASGQYVVSLVREAGCGDAAGVASVSVSVGDRALGPFNHALPEPGGRVEVARFAM